ncbi:unnamed protein product [Trichogramma brassicae]|uniref:Uncharacterized protein n=1 Tax=Trichogramma brassicae TaxID=86971 RepID=A0A6H5HXP0_9HYME|nr:unnamed protein product [Trichogramma brassicae]
MRSYQCKKCAILYIARNIACPARVEWQHCRMPRAISRRVREKETERKPTPSSSRAEFVARQIFCCFTVDPQLRNVYDSLNSSFVYMSLDSLFLLGLAPECIVYYYACTSVPGRSSAPRTPTTQTSHSMLPMNMVSQKITPSADQSAGSIKPLTNQNFSPNNQPLSLIQEHRPLYQPPFTNNTSTDQMNSEVQTPNQPTQVNQVNQQQAVSKETDTVTQVTDNNKLTQNGTEPAKEKPEAAPTSVTPATTVASTTQVNTTTTNKSAPVTDVVVPATNATTSPVKAAPTVTTSPVKVAATASEQNKHVTANSEPTPTSNQQTSPVKPKPEENVPPKVVDNQVSAPTTEENKPAVTNNQKTETTEPKAEVVAKEAPAAVVAKTEQETTAKSEPTTPKTPQKNVKAENSEVKTEGTPTKTPVRTPAKRKPREPKLKTPSTPAEGSAASSRSRRARTQTTPYQAPSATYNKTPKTPAVSTSRRSAVAKAQDEKLTIFYKGEFLAVRNADGSFFVCQANQNIYKSSKKINVRWLSQDKDNGEIYTPDFYDYIDEAQLQKKRKADAAAKNKNKAKPSAKRPRKKSQESDSDEEEEDDSDDGETENANDDSSSDDDDDEDAIKSADSKRKSGKKRALNRSAMSQATKVAKGPTRAERALNRSKGPKNLFNKENIIIEYGASDFFAPRLGYRRCRAARRRRGHRPEAERPRGRLRHDASRSDALLHRDARRHLQSDSRRRLATQAHFRQVLCLLRLHENGESSVE